MRNALTASERRGILVVAGVALIITACGWGMSMCRHDAPEENIPEVEVLVRGDSTTGGDTTAMRKKRRRNNKNDSVSRKKVKSHKQYRRRSPLDEPL